MENASKAITMAGGILLALMVVSLLVFGFTRISNYKNEQEKAKTSEQQIEYNKKFESYNKSVVRGYELISMANLIADVNTKYKEDDGYIKMKAYSKLTEETALDNCGLNADNNTKKYLNKYIDLFDYVNGTTSNNNSNDSKIIGVYKLLPNNGKNFKDLYFECNDIIYGSNGIVNQMYFSQITKK